MFVYFCSTCGNTVPEQNLKAGTAVMVAADKIHCFRCITSRVAKVSERTVRRALLAKQTETGLRRAVQRISQRLLKQRPISAIQRAVKRISQRFLAKTASYPDVGSSPRNRAATNPAAKNARAARIRSETNSVIFAAVCAVVLLAATLIAAVASRTSRQDAGAPISSNASPAPVAPAAPAAPIAAQGPGAAPAASSVETARLPAKPKSAAVETRPVAPPIEKIPPLLAEREAGAPDFRAQLAAERLYEAKAFRREHPADSAAWQKKLADIAASYTGTPAAEDAARMLAELTGANRPPKRAESLGWFAGWQAENLELHAKALMYEEFSGHAFVLETHPPRPGQALRFTRKLSVPAGKPFCEIRVRAQEQGEAAIAADVNGKPGAPEIARGAEWRCLYVDLSASAGNEALLTLCHSGTGFAYWDNPRFVAQPAADAIHLRSAEAVAEETRKLKDIAASKPAPAPADIKIEYEKVLLETYAALADKGARAAQGRLAKALNDPLFAPLRSKLELDAEALGYLHDLREGIAAGAARLSDNRAFTLVRNDGKEFSIGGEFGLRWSGSNAEHVILEQEMEGVRAQVKLALDELAPKSRAELAMLGMPPAEAHLKLAFSALNRLAAGGEPALAPKIRARLEEAAKGPELAGKSAHLAAHLALHERGRAAREDFARIEAQVKAAQWREAKELIEKYRAAYLNTLALERVQPALEQWSAVIAKELASPVLKR